LLRPSLITKVDVEVTLGATFCEHRRDVDTAVCTDDDSLIPGAFDAIRGRDAICNTHGVAARASRTRTFQRCGGPDDPAGGRQPRSAAARDRETSENDRTVTQSLSDKLRAIAGRVRTLKLVLNMTNRVTHEFAAASDERPGSPIVCSVRRLINWNVSIASAHARCRDSAFVARQTPARARSPNSFTARLISSDAPRTTPCEKSRRPFETAAPA
jgi:hypothetical protein